MEFLMLHLWFTKSVKKSAAHRMLKTLSCSLLLGLSSSLLQGQTLNPRWEPLNDPGTLGYGSCLEISPYDSRVMLTSGDVFGVGLTTDGGITWQRPTGITDYEDS